MSVNSQKDTLKLFWRVSNKYKWRRGLSLAIAVANFAVGMFVIPLIIASFLDLVQSGQLDESRVWGLITVYALAQLWSEVIGWRVVIYLMWTFQVSMQRDLYAEIFDKLSNQTMFFHSNKFGGSLVSQSNKITGAIERFWDTIVWSLFPVLISVIGSTIVLWFIYWPYALFMAILSITFVIAVYFGSKHMARLNEEEAKASNKISGHLSDVVANILTVKASSAEKRELKNLYVVQQRTDKSGKIAKNDVIITATRAYQVPSKDTDSSMQLDLFQGRRYELGTNNAKYNQASFEKYRITLEKPTSEKITETNVETQTTAKLLANTQKPEVKAELGYRFTMPWLIIIAAMLATPLAQVRPRQGRWLRLLPSVLIFASCAISIISLRTAIGKESISEYAYIWLIVGFIAFALLLNWQSRVVHRVRYRRQSSQLSPGGQP